MSDFYWISQEYPEDQDRFAKLVEPRDDYTYFQFYVPKPIGAPPPLVWSWSAGDELADWCPATSIARLFSPRMAEVVQANLGPKDQVQWIPATVLTPDGQSHPRLIPHFLAQPSLIDERARDWWMTGVYTDQVLSRTKAEGRHFTGRVNAAGSIVVSATMLDALLDANLTGIVVTPARVNE